MSKSLGDRMKEYYESRSQSNLIRRMPVIIRLDGKAFHTFTKSMKKPFDDVFSKTMQDTMLYLCKNIQGCVLGYTQSDEITLVLIDYKDFDSDAWFDYNVQKLCSITASMATMAFNRALVQHVKKLMQTNLEVYEKHYKQAIQSGAVFDSRCFNVPKEEVTNCIFWRQLDATRNSIQMVGQHYFTQAELENKSGNDIQEMLFTHKGINWNDLPIKYKRGSCCVKIYQAAVGFTVYSSWLVDDYIPIFKGDDRDYIERLINFE